MPDCWYNSIQYLLKVFFTRIPGVTSLVLLVSAVILKLDIELALQVSDAVCWNYNRVTHCSSAFKCVT